MADELLASCLDAPFVVISVIGPHANEGVDDIFRRKMDDIRSAARTLWLVTSSKVRPLAVQEMCRAGGGGYVVFVESSGVPRPTTTEIAAVEYSTDQQTWQPLPAGVGPVTGKLGPSAKAFIFNALELCHGEPFDMWAYGESPDGTSALDTRIGHSTVCALKCDTSGYPKRMKSRFRRIAACGRLEDPFCVWLR
jgi:hypothetical protein